MSTEENDSTKVFVGGLAWATDDEVLRQRFKEFGEIVDARVLLEPDTGRSRGYGFITYATHEEAKRAIKEGTGIELDGRTLRVDWAAYNRSGAERKHADRGKPPSYMPADREDGYNRRREEVYGYEGHRPPRHRGSSRDRSPHSHRRGSPSGRNDYRRSPAVSSRSDYDRHRRDDRAYAYGGAPYDRRREYDPGYAAIGYPPYGAPPPPPPLADPYASAPASYGAPAHLPPASAYPPGTRYDDPGYYSRPPAPAYPDPRYPAPLPPADYARDSWTSYPPASERDSYYPSSAPPPPRDYPPPSSSYGVPSRGVAYDDRVAYSEPQRTWDAPTGVDIPPTTSGRVPPPTAYYEPYPSNGRDTARYPPPNEAADVSDRRGAPEGDYRRSRPSADYGRYLASFHAESLDHPRPPPKRD